MLAYKISIFLVVVFLLIKLVYSDEFWNNSAIFGSYLEFLLEPLLPQTVVISMLMSLGLSFSCFSFFCFLFFFFNKQFLYVVMLPRSEI